MESYGKEELSPRSKELPQPTIATTWRKSSHIEILKLGDEIITVKIPYRLLQCPLTQCFSEDPVITPNGDLYDGKALREYLKRHDNHDPLGNKLSAMQLVPDTFRREINAWINVKIYSKPIPSWIKLPEPQLGPDDSFFVSHANIRVVHVDNHGEYCTLKIKLDAWLEDSLNLVILPVPYCTPIGRIYEENEIREFLRDHNNTDPYKNPVSQDQLYFDRFRMAITLAIFKLPSGGNDEELESRIQAKLWQCLEFAIGENDIELTDKLMGLIHAEHQKIPHFNELLVIRSGELTHQQYDTDITITLLKYALMLRQEYSFSELLERINLNSLSYYFIKEAFELALDEERENFIIYLWYTILQPNYPEHHLRLLRDSISPRSPDMATILYQTPSIKNALQTPHEDEVIVLAFLNSDFYAAEYCLNLNIKNNVTLKQEIVDRLREIAIHFWNADLLALLRVNMPTPEALQPREDIVFINELLNIMNEFLDRPLNNNTISFIKAFGQFLYKHLGIDPDIDEDTTLVDEDSDSVYLFQTFETINGAKDTEATLACPSMNYQVDPRVIRKKFKELNVNIDHNLAAQLYSIIQHKAQSMSELSTQIKFALSPKNFSVHTSSDVAEFSPIRNKS